MTCSLVACVSAEEPMREWVSAAGTAIEAALVGMNPATEQVILRREDGKVITVSIAQLSPADQDFLKSLSESPEETGQATPSESLVSATREAEEAARRYGGDFARLQEKGDLPVSSHLYESIAVETMQEALLARLCRVPRQEIDVSRDSMPVVESERGNEGHIVAGIVSCLLWWDAIGLVRLDVRGDLDEKREFIERKLRSRGYDDWGEIAAEIYGFLDKEADEELIGLRATLIEHTTPDLLNVLTQGPNMVFTALTAASERLSIDWVNTVCITDVEGDVVTFQMWSRSFKAWMKTTPEEFLSIGRNRSFIELELMPDPDNHQIDYIKENEWRLFFSYETLALSPVFKGQPLP
ncbi:MAG: hypothetical protein AAGA96_03735 [Verrucomicrobiota bacterium]